MEAFLSTLPPYVHEFLGKHPPTDVFNLLKELICFAVLYSNDRALIQTTTETLIKKQQNLETSQEQVKEEEEEEAIVPESHPIETIKEEEIKPVSKPTYNIRTGELIQNNVNTTMPNTFPSWWGDRTTDLNHPITDTNKPHGRFDNLFKDDHHLEKQEVKEVKKEEVKRESLWISFDNAPEKPNPHRLERARSQIIPNLRSYPSEDTPKASQPSSATLKRHSTLNLKSSVSPPPARSTNSTTPRLNTVKQNRRLSTPPVCESPTTQSKFALTAAKQQKARGSDTSSNVSSDTTKVTAINKPRPNAAVRARAEHARLRNLEQEQKKKVSNTPVVSSHSLRLKERVNSGIDWETIKKERRNTIAEETVSKKK